MKLLFGRKVQGIFEVGIRLAFDGNWWHHTHWFNVVLCFTGPDRTVGDLWCLVNLGTSLGVLPLQVSCLARRISFANMPLAWNILNLKSCLLSCVGDSGSWLSASRLIINISDHFFGKVELIVKCVMKPVMKPILFKHAKNARTFQECNSPCRTEAKCDNVWMEVCSKTAAVVLVSAPGPS
jgi:hypothetical protein